MNGFLVLDKPEGISSAGVVARVKRALRAKKAGHTGTLDPGAAGVLVCGIDQATRLARFLLHARKSYAAELTLGSETDTQDASGRILERRPVPGELDAATLAGVLRRYEGEQWQSPPAYSALKQDGVPLYALARRGQPVVKPARRVSIFAIRLLAVELPRLRFEVSCSGGTYIRSLCADIGRDLGCGGHMSRLTRLECHGFSLAQAIGLEKFEAAAACGEAERFLVPMAQALPHVPEILARPALLEKLRCGRPLVLADLGPEPPVAPEGEGEQPIKIVTPEGELAAVLQAVPGRDALEYCCVFRVSERLER